MPVACGKGVACVVRGANFGTSSGQGLQLGNCDYCGAQHSPWPFPCTVSRAGGVDVVNLEGGAAG